LNRLRPWPLLRLWRLPLRSRLLDLRRQSHQLHQPDLPGHLNPLDPRRQSHQLHQPDLPCQLNPSDLRRQSHQLHRPDPPRQLNRSRLLRRLLSIVAIRLKRLERLFPRRHSARHRTIRWSKPLNWRRNFGLSNRPPRLSPLHRWHPSHPLRRSHQRRRPDLEHRSLQSSLRVLLRPSRR
jgi:hypothetical protein